MTTLKNKRLYYSTMCQMYWCIQVAKSPHRKQYDIHYISTTSMLQLFNFSKCLKTCSSSKSTRHSNCPSKSAHARHHVLVIIKPNDTQRRLNCPRIQNCRDATTIQGLNRRKNTVYSYWTKIERDECGVSHRCALCICISSSGDQPHLSRGPHFK